MQMFVHITNHESTISPILGKMMESGFRGATVIDCEGMLSALNQDSVNAPAIFGSLRKFVNPDRQKNKIILAVLKDEDIQEAIDIIHEICGDLNVPNKGIVFSVPITRWEGIDKRK